MTMSVFRFFSIVNFLLRQYLRHNQRLQFFSSVIFFFWFFFPNLYIWTSQFGCCNDCFVINSWYFYLSILEFLSTLQNTINKINAACFKVKSIVSHWTQIRSLLNFLILKCALRMNLIGPIKIIKKNNEMLYTNSLLG